MIVKLLQPLVNLGSNRDKEYYSMQYLPISFGRYHLQAFRHLYVLAAEPRVIVPREVDTGKACYAPLEVTLKVHNSIGGTLCM